MNMVEEEHSLETLLAKATNPLHRTPDPKSLNTFCSQVEKDPEGPQFALRLLGHKIQSPNEREAILALLVLEESVKKCGTKFRNEVGKFRFLNEMIKVVSPKYLGSRASYKVKQRIIELLFKWSVELKQEPKIFEAYQMLKRQGVVHEDPVGVLENYEPPPPPPPRPKNAIFEDEEKAQLLQRLLRSRNAEDLQAANKLIKGMVKEADRRMELLAKRTTELETVSNNVKVLADMLTHYKPGETSSEETELMQELYESCERLRPKLFRIAGEMDEKDDGLGDILKANDELTSVINQYKKIMGVKDSISDESSSMATCKLGKGEASLLDLGSPPQVADSVMADTSLLDDQLLALGLSDPFPISENQVSLTNNDKAISSSGSSNLEQLFSEASSNPAASQTTQSFSMLTPIVNTLPSMQGPFSHSPAVQMQYVASAAGVSQMNPSFGNIVQNTGTTTFQPIDLSKSHSSMVQGGASLPNQTKLPHLPPSKGLEEIDALGQTLLKQSLPPSSVSKVDFPKPISTPQKIPLNQLQKQLHQQQQQQHSSAPSSPSPLRSAIASSCLSTSSNAIPSSVLDDMSSSTSPASELINLNDLEISIETIQPGSLKPLTLLEKNGLTVVVHFGRDNPRPDVNVMVISTMSKNTSPVKNFNFQAAVPKMMLIKLQPPSATDLPAHNPILPPAAITQVMLLANPSKEKVRLKYKVSYTISEELHSDIGEVDSLLEPR